MTVTLVKNVTHVVSIVESINGVRTETYRFTSDNSKVAREIAYYESLRYVSGYGQPVQGLRDYMFRASKPYGLYEVSIKLTSTKN